MTSEIDMARYVRDHETGLYNIMVGDQVMKTDLGLEDADSQCRLFNARGQGIRVTGSRVTETLTHPGAMALAKQLTEYWHARGYLSARFWTVPIGRFEKVGTYEVYTVKSNLRNGSPPVQKRGLISDWDSVMVRE